MNYSNKTNDINRLEFLRKSGLLVAGTALLPRLLNANIKDDKYNEDVSGLKISGYQIVVHSQADDLERQAAQELQRYLSKISTSKISVLTENDNKSSKAVYIGKTNFAKAHKVDFANIEADGYIFKTAGKNLIISGGAKKGVLYGVYDFLEESGFKKLALDDVFIPTT